MENKLHGKFNNKARSRNTENRPQGGRRSEPSQREVAEASENIVAGRNAVRELLSGERDIEKIYVQSGEREGSIGQLVAMARERKIPLMELDRNKLDKMCPGIRHQGIVAIASQASYSSVEDILAYAKERGEEPLVIILDGVEDPHNLGAIIRSAECLGAHGIIIPKRRAVGITPIVAKASAGAVSYMRVAKVTNISSAIDELKEKGLWIYAADMGGSNIYSTDMRGAVGLVLGSEGFGISHLVKERCDFVVSIPQVGKVNSMNVSCAAAVLMSEVIRQRAI